LMELSKMQVGVNKEVCRVGPATMERIRPYITVE